MFTQPQTSMQTEFAVHGVLVTRYFGNERLALPVPVNVYISLEHFEIMTDTFRQVWMMQ